MILLDILKIKTFLKYFRSIFLFLSYILRGDVSYQIKFEQYPSIISKGKIRIGKNVFLGKNISFKVYTGGILEIEDDAVISNNCSFNVRENSRIKVGKHTRINSGSIISGDVNIENNVIVAPNVIMISDSHRISEDNLSIDEADEVLGLKLGSISIKKNAFIGAGAVILHNTYIGINSVIGSHALVLDDVDDGMVVVGPKAKVISKN